MCVPSNKQIPNKWLKFQRHQMGPTITNNQQWALTAHCNNTNTGTNVLNNNKVGKSTTTIATTPTPYRN